MSALQVFIIWFNNMLSGFETVPPYNIAIQPLLCPNAQPTNKAEPALQHVAIGDQSQNTLLLLYNPNLGSRMAETVTLAA